MSDLDDTAQTSNGRRSPPTERVIQVLDFLVARNDRRYGLSELARQLEISKPTCLGIVTALVNAGYLTRDPVEKTYGLGPALIAAGRAAQEGFAVGPIARRHLAELSERFGTTCTASTVVGDQITILELTSPPGVSAPAKVGQVYPFAPPVGLMYVIWSADDDVDSWLAREPALPVRYDRDRLRRVVERCRSDGFLVEMLSAMGQRLHTAMAGVATHELPSELRKLLGEMVSSMGEPVYLGEPEHTGNGHPVNLVAAPTYDADGRQALVLTLYVGASIENDEIATRGAALIDAARAITEEIGGRHPLRCRRVDSLTAG